MTPERWQRAQEVFESAVRRTPEARAAYLDGACGNDAEMRREVESLIKSHDSQSQGFLEKPAIEEMESATGISPGRKPISRGSRLGSFEIVGPLGAGGMGEVYKARDPRLGRDVAIKVLPLEVTSDKERLKRFEKEARAASALNHPNIVTIYETGATDGVPWIAMEHVEGETLRKLVVDGPLQTKKLLNVATQIGEGLARAHEAGIVHRDLKPENVMVTKDGLVKILDFGLAKLQGPVSGGSDKESQLPTVTGTSPGIVLGTVGYMSPEQASGKPVDFRSDQFSFGSILYEMATGKRAFQKKTAVETLTAILNEEPEPIASVAPRTPAPLRWLVERCLQKERETRYVSTRDLARELAGLRDHLSEANSGIAVSQATSSRSRRTAVLAGLAIAVSAAIGYFASNRTARPALQPGFQKVTFQMGGVWRARFAPDGQTVVYSMIGVGDDLRPPELYSTRVGSLDSRSLGLPAADIFSISNAGQMAIGLTDPKDPMWGNGTLAEASLTGGGTPRQILEDVGFADWSPNGKELAVLHRNGGKPRVEFPVGTVLYESSDVGEPRVSPDGKTVAFVSEGDVKVVDRKGAVQSVLKGVAGNVWSPRGDEFWWLKQINHVSKYTHSQACELHATNLTGRDRVLATLPGDFVLHDVSRDGRVLLERDDTSYEMMATFPGKSERSLAWLDQSIPADLSRDGQILLFGDRGDAAGTSRGVYLRKTDGSAAVRLGEGIASRLSPDGKWALAMRETDKGTMTFVLLPTGPGQERALPTSGVVYKPGFVGFHPDGKRIFFPGIESGHRQRAYELSIDGGVPKPVTPEGLRPALLSPDGATLLVRNENDDLALSSIAGTTDAPRFVAHLAPTETPVHWNADGRSVLVVLEATRPIRVDRLDLSSGRRTLWRTFSSGWRLGMGEGTEIVFSANEEAYVSGYRRSFSELLVVDGLK